ncbi:cyclic nucleotide-binding domain-containing protein [Jatrophihabitans endophyticus]|uniref:Crp/Fnr family transcriptional regulator n=1 Tax=Jatrophihabitans endophyticus TaxID=1206085 RepID=UPI0019F37406|nr:cyclic nucleotide-binding domain-containing protein [Jatrophihabitans endophyticus]MBE7190050.1 cyclic nucleotide-binding domain-containing protein [Jatrophihabitans endophyticus]
MPGEKSRLVSELADYATFADCSKSDITALVDAGGRFTLPAGWPLVQEGIPADACYVLTEGTALVFSQREQIAEIGAGDLVGETTLLGGGQRTATVTSSSRVAGLRVENDALKPVLDKHPKLAEAFRAVYDAHQR